MRVLIISRGIPSEESPLDGYFEFNQADALANEGVDVTYFATDLRSIRRRRHLGISKGKTGKIKWYVISVPLGNIPVKLLCKIGSRILYYLYKKVYANTESPDIIHAHFTEYGCISSYLSEKEGIPLVITEHSSAMNKDAISNELKECALRGYNQASKVIAVGTHLSQRIKRNTGVDSIVIPNMLHLSVFENISKEEHVGFRIVTTANLIPLKRTINLIDAICVLKDEWNDVHLDIIGDGPLKADLMKKVIDCKLGDIITFHGYKKDYEIAEIYKYCDCFALVSSSETFGVVYIEAMASGLPVIASRCGGPNDFVNDSNGLLVDIDDIQQLIDALRYIRTHLSNYNESELKDFVKKSFSPKVVASRLIETYNTVLNEKS